MDAKLCGRWKEKSAKDKKTECLRRFLSPLA